MIFKILVEAFLLYITMHLVFLTYLWFWRRFVKIGKFLAVFALPSRPQGWKSPKIYNICIPCPKDASNEIEKNLE
jgi:hypothetical protein